MDAELRTKWIAALRSGQYEQGRGYLCMVGEDDQMQYCCFGVLFDLEGAEWTQEGTETTRGCTFDKKTYRGNSQRNELAAAFPFLSVDEIGNLMDMNDYQCSSFPEIADYIEKNL